MVQFNLSYDQNISLEQRIAYEVAANILKSFLTDDATVDIHFVSTSDLDGGNAVGGAVPIFHRVNYGILSAYIAQDASSYIDDQSVIHLQTGNTIDLSAYGEVIDGNTEILLTTAQAEALGLDEALQLENGGLWDRDIVHTTGLDGYILVNQDFEWNNDVLRTDDAPEGTLDSLSMALHEMLHIMGFVSGIDGTIEFNQLFSGQTEVTGTTLLDLFRYSSESRAIENPDGSVSTITEGEAAYLSADGGLSNLGDFATGQSGDGYQASHWQRMQVALGIMDPTLAFQERLSMSERDLQALDLLGWNVDYSVLDNGLDMEALLLQAEQTVAVRLGLDSTALTEHRVAGDAYTMGFSEWWALFEDQIIEMGFSEWWQVLEVGYDKWMQQQENPDALLQMGFSEWWQSFEATIIGMGFSEWWQTFETNMLTMGFSEWWQVLEMGFSEWWQQLETYFSVLEKTEGTSPENKLVADGGVRGRKAKVFRGGDNDNIIAGDEKQDRIKAGDGDDLVDGKAGHDVIWGEAGRDMLYGQNGNDLLYGGDDNDLLLGEAGDDRLHGGAGDDIVSGGSGDDIVAGGEGKDNLKGGWGRDVLDGDDGNDLLKGEADSDVLIGGEGRDQVHGGGGNDVIYGDAYQGSGNLRALRRQLQEQAETGSNSTSETASSKTATSNPIWVEAESMTLSGDAFIHTTWNNDSGNSVKTTGSSTSSTIFSGSSGNYMAVVRYFDKAGGAGRLDFGLDGTSLNSFDLDQETDHYYTRTIAQNITLNTGDEFAVTATSDGADEAAFDYIEFIPLDSLLETPLEQVSSSSVSVSTASTTSSDGTVSTSATTTEATFRLEAEAMSLVGDYYIESNNAASGGSLIAVSNQGQGKALSTFSGEAGYYNIVVGYYDESDEGIGQLSAALNNIELDAWSLNQNLGSILANAQTFTTRTVASTVFLRDGDIFELTGRRGEGSSSDELARVDYIDFVKVNFSESTQASESTATNNTLIDDELVAHWTFDDTNGTVVSDTTTVHNATVINSSVNNNRWVEGNLEGAISLDGVDDYVAVADSDAINLETNAQRTVSLWFKADDKNTSEHKQVLYEEGGGTRGLNIYIHDGRLYAGGWNLPSNQSNWAGTYLQTGDIVSGRWHHVTLVLDGDEQVRDGAFTAYLDGVRFGSGEGSQLWRRSGNVGFGAVNDGTRFHDGTSGSTGSNAFAGSLDEARIYNRALEDAEIALLVGRDNDFLQGGAGNDTIYGGEGDDTIYGESASNAISSILKGSHTYNGHTYLFSQAGTWQEAQAEARQLGGNLVTINDAEEEAWIREVFSDSERLWTGINDAAAEGEFEWISGETVTYTNWAQGQPDDYQGNQDYGTINYYNHWDDDTDNAVFRGIVEIDTADNDVLVGGSGHDTIYGNSGDDVLYGDSPSETLSPLMVEAEDFSLGGGYFVEALDGVSRGNVIRTDTTGTANLSFTGDNGLYDIVVHYYDENDGSSTLALNVNGAEADSWSLNQNNSDSHIFSDSRTISGVSLSTLNTIQLTAVANNGEFARIDYVEFIPTTEPSPSASMTNDEFYNDSGNDYLYGGIGSDVLEGGAGNDVLDGSDEIAAGYFEKDILGGGLGADTFVVGNADQAYYVGGGDRDFVLIKDFNAAEDVVQLHGSADDYTRQQEGNDTYLSYQGDTSDLVAVFENTSSVSLNVGFVFV
ncbi:MAG: NF038122 family metalloprotease [Cyanobacteria bacterium P01_D01_bin.1]